MTWVAQPAERGGSLEAFDRVGSPTPEFFRIRHEPDRPNALRPHPQRAVLALPVGDEAPL